MGGDKLGTLLLGVTIFAAFFSNASIRTFACFVFWSHFFLLYLIYFLLHPFSLLNVSLPPPPLFLCTSVWKEERKNILLLLCGSTFARHR